jgi:hypothetical protein
MNEQYWKKLLQDLAEAETGNSIDLWPGIEARVQKQRSRSAFLRLAPRLAAAGALLTIVALFVSWLEALPRGGEGVAAPPDVTRVRATTTVPSASQAPEDDAVAAVISDIVGDEFVLRRFPVGQAQQAGPVTITVHEVVFAEEGTYVLVEVVYPPRQQFELMGQRPVLTVQDRRFEADYLGQNLNAHQPVALYFPVLPEAGERLALTVPRIWAVVDVPATITLDVQQVGEGGQHLGPQTVQVGDYTVRFTGIVHEPQPGVGFILTYVPVGEAAREFHLDGPGSPNPQIRDDLGNVYQGGGGTIFDDEEDATAVWGSSELRVTEPLHPEAGQLTLTFEQTGRFYGPLTFEIGAPQAEPKDEPEPREVGTQTGAAPITAAQRGITLTLRSVDYSEDETRMAFEAVVKPPWTLGADGEPLPSADAGDFPPMPNSLMATMMSLEDGQGRIIAPRSFSGGAVDRELATDAFTETFTLTFDPVPGDSRAFSLSVHLEVHEPPADGVLVVDWANGQRASTETLSIAGIPLIINSLERVGEDGLQVTAPVVRRDGITISCLHLYPPQSFVREEASCRRMGDEIVSSVTLVSAPEDGTVPAGGIPLYVRGTVTFETPWRLSWER